MSQPDFENGVFVEFFMDAVELTFRSEEEGRPIFEDRPHVKILVPGDQSVVNVRVATDAEIRKYPKAWQRFKNSEVAGVSGMPLEQWPQITRAMLKEAKYFEVHTVEQMAQISDSSISKMGMGFMELRNKAKAYLEAAAGTANATKDAAEKARMQMEIDDLKRQIAEIATPKRGRPPKELAEAL